MFHVVNFFLFGSPNEHAGRLQRVWVDGIIIRPRWKDFIDRFTTNLGQCILLVSYSCFACGISYGLQSTVMLTVDFSFLAITGVVTAGEPANLIRLIIYCSVVSTIGSLFFSFTLLNLYSEPEPEVTGSAVCFYGRYHIC